MKICKKVTTISACALIANIVVLQAAEPPAAPAFEAREARFTQQRSKRTPKHSRHPKTLHVIPVSYNPGNNQFTVLLTQPAKQGEYRAFPLEIPSLLGVHDPALLVQAISNGTYGAYAPNLEPLASSNQTFAVDGNPARKDTQKGYVFIEVQFTRGLDICKRATAILGSRPTANFNWLSRDEILGTAPGEAPERIHGPINAELLTALKNSLPVLKKRPDNELVITRFEEEVAAPGEAPKALECPVCFTNQPNVTLPCGHKLCQGCLEAIKKSAHPLCPICSSALP